MVKIAISGGSGEVAHEIIDKLLAKGKHEIVILSRKDPNPEETIEGTTWAKVDYADKESLLRALQGAHTVLCFITSHLDPEGTAQKNLVDAAIEAGVKRFAPSEWSAADSSVFPWYSPKLLMREYLVELNKDKKVIEYTLFQPGMFLDYFANPYKTSKYLTQLEMNIDFQNRRAIVLDGLDYTMVYTALKDLTDVVVRAIEYEGEWPVTGGIRGNLVSASEILAIGEKVRGKPFSVEKLKTEDLKTGEIKSSWWPRVGHPSVPKEQVDAMSKMFLAGCLLGAAAGAYTVSDEWNRLLPDYKFTGIEEFLSDVWAGKP
ncbi:hypothetical protein B0H66DRAFT_396595 [Apodospora peruviana]|uniref:NmrA-like domain-containing protein n=1 Tax=Apodospora peruviana TaxID=516989 RepID=A0AAE0HSY7_9PEZI|nr:hypothetical protein B0H66DRAFT_396595 [Apodospora peruviana]